MRRAVFFLAQGHIYVFVHVSGPLTMSIGLLTHILDYSKYDFFFVCNFTLLLRDVYFPYFFFLRGILSMTAHTSHEECQY